MEELLVLAQMSAEDRLRKLAELGEVEAGPPGAQPKSLWSSAPKAYEHTSHAFGYLPPSPAPNALAEVVSATAIAADEGLKRRRLKITLDQLRVARYPGGGRHLVLVQFQATHQRRDGADDLEFGATFRAVEGQGAGIASFPVFIGLNAGADGVSLRCTTINIKNDDDERFLAFLESSALQQGLELVETLQPAVKPLSKIAQGIARSVAKRHRNVPVQEFFLGLDFGRNATAAKLAEGTYFAVQVPEEVRVRCWDEWAFNPRAGALVTREDGQPIPYNYLAFGVSRMG